MRVALAHGLTRPRPRISRSTFILWRSTAPRRHGVPDDDITHAYVHALAWLELDDAPPRYLLAGPDMACNLLERVVARSRGVDHRDPRHTVAHRHSPGTVRRTE